MGFEKRYGAGLADATGLIALTRDRPKIELIPATGEMPLQLPERLVLLVAHPIDGHLQGFGDFGNRPTSGPKLDDAILPLGQDGSAGGFEDFSQLEPRAIRLLRVKSRNVLLIKDLMPLGSLNALANHVDGSNEFATLRRVVRQNEVEIKLAGSGLAEKSAADFLGTVIPDAGIEPGVSPADGAVALDVADQVRLGGVRCQGREPNDQGHRGRTSSKGRFPLG